MKKLLVFILAAMLICGGILPQAVAETQGNYEYTLNPDGTATITRVNRDCTEEAVPSELDGHTVTEIGNLAYNQCKKLKSIVIPDTVTAVGDYVFQGCSSLTSITIPDSVSSIGDTLILWGKLKTINISREHPYLAYNNGALIRKSDMTLIKFIGTKGNEYDVIWGIKRIAPYAFSGAKLQKINLPDTVTEIGDHAFMECTGLKELYIPRKVTYIGTQAFYQCTGLKSLEIPENVKEMGKGIADYCNNLKDFRILENNPVFEAKDNAVIRKKEGKLVFTYGLKNGAYTIPEEVRTMVDYAFSGSNLKSIILPEGLQMIPDGAFAYCRGLKEIIIPESVSKIGYRAFVNCESLSKVVIPAAVKFIADDALDGCRRLTCTVEEGSYAQTFCEEKGIKYEIAAKDSDNK